MTSDDSVLLAPPGDVRFDAGSHPRARIGNMLLATEQTIQDDVFKLRPPGVGIHFTRAAIADSITNELLAAQADLLADCAATLLPDGSLDVIAEIETRAGKPAICSNQAMIWDCLRLAGIDDRFEGYGRLLSDF
jgi:maleate cis-trans isomerase